MRVVGVDPGVAITGYGIIDFEGRNYNVVEYNYIRTESNRPLAERLQVIYQSLMAVFQQFKPGQLAVEELFFNKNVRTVMAVSQARGVVLLAAANANLTVYEYTPLQVKQTLTGHGRAEKKQIEYMVRVLLKLPEARWPDDVIDALAVAICHVNHISTLYS
ncbi:MAG: crossover junction endodeoxyribonuclease RuvC [Peptococcaceae bacterium]